MLMLFKKQFRCFSEPHQCGGSSLSTSPLLNAPPSPPSPPTTHTHTRVFTVVCLVNKTEAFSSSGTFTEVSRATEREFVSGRLFPAPVVLHSLWSDFLLLRLLLITAWMVYWIFLCDFWLNSWMISWIYIFFSG